VSERGCVIALHCIKGCTTLNYLPIQPRTVRRLPRIITSRKFNITFRVKWTTCKIVLEFGRPGGRYICCVVLCPVFKNTESGCSNLSSNSHYFRTENCDELCSRTSLKFSCNNSKHLEDLSPIRCCVVLRREKKRGRFH
jgi:hypothetical protein